MKFEPISYFESLAEKNKLCRNNKFKSVLCSGPDNIEGVMADFRKTENFIIIDDMTDNHVYNSKPTWFTRSVYTVWIIAASKFNDMDDRKAKLNLCRRIFKQFLSKMINDKARLTFGQDMYYLNLSKVYYKELGRYSFNGATGLYFMVENDVPEDLRFSDNDWDD